MIIDFDGMTNEQIIATTRSLLGARSPQEIEAASIAEKARYEREQAYYAEMWNAGERWFYKRACPVCGTVFYTTNPRRKYDDYYECSRYQHRRNAKIRRKSQRMTKCETCGKWFFPSRKGAKYCCAACKQRGYRKRKQIAQNGHTE